MITVEHCAQQPIFVARACATSLTLAPKESSLTPQRLLRVLIQNRTSSGLVGFTSNRSTAISILRGAKRFSIPAWRISAPTRVSAHSLNQRCSFVAVAHSIDRHGVEAEHFSTAQMYGVALDGTSNSGRR